MKHHNIQTMKNKIDAVDSASVDCHTYQLPQVKFLEKDKSLRQSREEEEHITPQKVKEIKENAYNEGHTLGRSEGYLAGQLVLQKTIVEMTHALNYLAKPLENLSNDLLNSLTNLSANVGHKIAMQALEIDPEKVKHIIKSAIKTLPECNQNIKVYMNDNMLRYWKDNSNVTDKDGNNNYVELDVDVELITDNSLNNGDCRIECDDTRVVYNNNEILEKILQELLPESIVKK